MGACACAATCAYRTSSTRARTCVQRALLSGSKPTELRVRWRCSLRPIQYDDGQRRTAADDAATAHAEQRRQHVPQQTGGTVSRPFSRPSQMPGLHAEIRRRDSTCFRRAAASERPGPFTPQYWLSMMGGSFAFVTQSCAVSRSRRSSSNGAPADTDSPLPRYATNAFVTGQSDHRCPRS